MEISPFATVVKEQGKGVGRKLIDHVRKTYKEENVDMLRAWVINWRTDLFPKYERLHFTKSDTIREYTFVKDEKR